MTTITDGGFARVTKDTIVRNFSTSGALTGNDIPYSGSLTVNEKIDSIVVGTSGDMVLASPQIVSGLKTFLDGTFGFRNVANTITSFFKNTATVARTYTFQDRDGTLADNTDLALKAPLASPTFTGTVGLPAGQVVNGVTLTTAGGTTNFLRADGTYSAPSGSGDMVLSSAQTNSGLKTFLDATFGLRNVANTITSLFTNTATVARTWTLPDSNTIIPIISQLLTFSGPLAARTITLPDANFTVARTDAANTFTGVQTMTSPVLTTPVINGLATGTGVASAATASTIATRDSNGNLSMNNWVNGFATTVTAGGTTTLTVASPMNQDFTGTLTQTVVLPVTSTLTLGHEFWITNLSTGAVTVQSSGLNSVLVVAAGTSALFTCILTSGTTAASWRTVYYSDIVASGKKVAINNSLTFAGTDSTTMTFPSTSATIARTDAANTFTGVQTMTSPNFITPVLGTPTSGTLTSCTGLPIVGLVASTSTAIGVGSIELAHASDTTISRVSAGVIAVEGINVLTTTSTETVTNKRVTKRTQTVTQSAIPSMNTDNGDIFQITGLAQAITSMTTSLTGTPADGDMIMIQITDNGTARAITWGASFASTTVILPTTTVISTMLRVVLQWSAGTSKWNCVGIA